MPQDPGKTCAESTHIKKYIHHYALKIHRIYPRLLEIDDAKHELWVALFRAIRERYLPQFPLIQFAKRAVFSHYGNMVKTRGNAGKLLNERAVLDYTPKFIDASYENVEVNFTLNQIENDLEKRAKEARQYRYALTEFQLLRKGRTLRDCCETLGISRSYGYRLFHEWIKECGKKYREGAITTL